MKQKLLFIFNPRSGKGQIRGKLLDIIDVFVKGGYEVIVHPTQGPMDACNMVQEMASEVDLIVCSGGDGTLDEVVTGLRKSHAATPIGYIPAGSTNDFAASLDLPKNMKKAAQVAVNGADFSCDVGCFGEKHFVYIAAFGLFTDVSYQTKQELKNVFGHVAYILEGAKRIGTHPSYRMRVEYNGGAIEDEFIYGMVTNSLSVGGFKGMTGDDVALNDGLFEVMLIKTPHNAVELNEIIAVLTKLRTESDMIYTFKTDELFISPYQTIPWTLDGEFGGEQTQIRLKNLRQALTIRVPGETQ